MPEHGERRAIAADDGMDTETPVPDEYDRASSQFKGKIDKVTINVK